MHFTPVRAQQGWLWVKAGLNVFRRHPLAIGGLFGLYFTVLSLLSIVPIIGPFMAAALVPIGTFGLMAASRQVAENGQFPMPSLLISGLRGDATSAKGMIVLGSMYALALAVVLALSSLFLPTPTLAAMSGQTVAPEDLRQAVLGPGILVLFALYMPLSAAFWHAPALVVWHRVGPLKALFFSWIACWRNARALLIFGLGWLAIALGVSFVLVLCASLLSDQLMATLSLPIVLMLAALFHASIYFTFRDSFSAENPQTRTE